MNPLSNSGIPDTQNELMPVSALPFYRMIVKVSNILMNITEQAGINTVFHIYLISSGLSKEIFRCL
jgi:hypothetical protein